VQFHVLSFEGPDAYARAGGLASRVDGLTATLCELGFETHLWFVGDPAAPGHERRGCLELHRWCQWISALHPGGVYDGEEGKQRDYAASLPPFLWREHLRGHLGRGGHAVVLAEEWQTVDALLHLDHTLRREGARERATLVWNANNTFGFERIPWERLRRAAAITTVSRYMKHLMRQAVGVEPLAIPNGLAPDAFDPPDAEGVAELQRRFRDRTVLVKMARFDPDKRWLLAVATAAELKRQGWRPLLVARGGREGHGHEVRAAARAAGLRIAGRRASRAGVLGLLEALEGVGEADFVELESYVDPEARRTLLRAADAVLANSAHEPFGLVGLETMAAGGLACTGISGEDYAVPGRNAIVLQTADPSEFVRLYQPLRARPEEEAALRREGRRTSRQYAWEQVVRRNLLPTLVAPFGFASLRGRA
jgi:glycosyltransferase involved in cell wall biosynthesis